MTEIITAEISYNKKNVTTAQILTEENFASGQTLELYDDNDLLSFRGTVYTKKYAGNVKTYDCVGLDKELNEKISGTYSSKTIANIYKYIIDGDTNGDSIIDGSPCSYLYRSSSIDPDGSLTTEISISFFEKTYKEIFDILADRGDGDWNQEPDGKVWVKAIADIDPISLVYEGTHDFEGIEMASETYYGSPDNFNDETVGTTGTDIAWVDVVVLFDGGCEIIAEEDGHKNVLQIQDDATAGEDPSITHNFIQTTSAIFEFWFKINDATNYVTLIPREGDMEIVALYMTGDMFYDWYDSSDHALLACVDDTWYHIKIVIRADNTHDIYIDGAIKTNNQNNRNNMVSGVNKFRIIMSGDTTNYVYIDGWGDPADANYSAGYNLNPYDITGIWDGIFSTLYCAHSSHIKISDIGGHVDVLELYDGTTTKDDGKDEVGGIISFIAQTSGTIELWVRGDDVTDQFSIHLMNSAVYGGSINSVLDKIRYWSGSVWVDAIGGGLSDDTWYHFRIDFDCNEGTNSFFDFYLNGVLLDSNVPFQNDQASINGLRIFTNHFPSAHTYYIDAIGFSWESNYTTGQNCGVAYGTDYIASNPEIVEIMAQINVVKIYGAISAGTRLVAEVTDPESILLHGRVVYIDHFPSMNNQTQLDNLATAILNRTGMADNPKIITVAVRNLDYVNLINSVHFSFSPYEDLQYFSNYYILYDRYDIKNNIHYLTISNGLVKENRTLGQSEGIKVLTADEEQISIMASFTSQVYTSSSDPTVNDDEDDGYRRGDFWINTTDDGSFICRNPAAGAADWKEI